MNMQPEKAPFAAYVCTDPGASLAREVIDVSGAPSGSLRGGGLSGAARAAGESAGAHMVLTELDDCSVPTACENVAALRDLGSDVIVFGSDPSIQTYRALRKAGALEYLPMPITAQDILSLELGTQEPANLTRPVERTHQTIGVIGTNGGVGASAFAQSLGYLASSKSSRGAKTALIDADTQFGTIALDLDRDGTPGLIDALHAPDRIDPTFLEGTMDHVSDALSVFSYASELQKHGGADTTGWSSLLSRVTTEFGTTLVDVPRSLVVREPDVVHGLDAAVLVVPAGYAGVNVAMRLLTCLSTTKPDLHLSFVLSEVRKDSVLSKKDIAKALGVELIAVLPRSDAQMTRAQRKGKTVSELYPRAPYTRACEAVLAALQGPEQSKARKAGWLSKVLR